MSSATASPAVKADVKPKVEQDVKLGGGGGGGGGQNQQNNRGPKRKRGESSLSYVFRS
jgi:hypothetical protein